MKRIIGILFSLLLAGQAHAAGQAIDETRPAQHDGEVRISNLAGSVRVEGWNRAEVQVTGTLGEGAERLEFTGSDATTSIRVILPQGRNRNIQATDLVVRVPAASRVQADTVSADVAVSGVSGAQRHETVSGDIELNTTATDISLKSVSGAQQINGAGENARVTVRSISGDITVTDVTGELQLETVSGEAQVRDSALNRASMSTTSGELDYSGALQKDGVYDFRSISGNIGLTFAGTPDAQFDISAFSGNIDNSFGPEAQKVSEYAPGKELRFTGGQGSARVSVETLSGNITLRAD